MAHKRGKKKRIPRRRRLRAGPSCRQSASDARDEERLGDLMEDGLYAEAFPLAERLLRSRPDLQSAHMASVACHRMADRPIEALQAAMQWTRACPDSPSAWVFQADIAAGLDALALTCVASERLVQLDAEAPEALTREEVLAELDTPYGPVPCFEELYALELAWLSIERADFATALRLLEPGRSVRARNQAALCLFYLRRRPEAQRAFRELWEEHPANLFALAWSIRLHLAQGEPEEAAALTTRLAAAQASTFDDAAAQLRSLLLVERFAESRAVWKKVSKAPWWAGLSVGEQAELMHLGATALLRDGRAGAAQRLWRKAVDLHSDFDSPTLALEDLQQPAGERDGPVIEPLLDVASAAVYELEKQLTAQRQGERWPTLAPEPGAAEAVARVVGAYAETAADFLVALHSLGNRIDRRLLSEALRERASRQEPGALEGLLALLGRPSGSDVERAELLVRLAREGLVKPGEAVSIHWRGQVREHHVPAELARHTYHREQEHHELLPSLARKRDRATLAFRGGDLDTALALFEELAARCPDDKILVGNLASAKQAVGRADEATELLERVVQLAPEYITARGNLVRIKLLDGDVSAAGGWLDDLQVPERLHVDDAFSLHGAQALLAAAQGDLLSCALWLQLLDTLAAAEHEHHQVEALDGLAVKLAEDAQRRLGWNG